ncbi:hypothetical protein FB451DRAFT_1472585 [Mycena latifolia]|nr:hypothetical protein FB451DRAFT_1472585 [Mycena latifolia]
MAGTDADVLISAAEQHISKTPNRTYGAAGSYVASLCPTNIRQTEEDAKRFNALRILGRTAIVAQLNLLLYPILFSRGLYTDDLLNSLIPALIDALELGNPTDTSTRRPADIFCAVAGFMEEKDDPKGFSNWLDESIGGVLAAIRTAAQNIPFATFLRYTIFEMVRELTGQDDEGDEATVGFLQLLSDFSPPVLALPIMNSMQELAVVNQIQSTVNSYINRQRFEIPKLATLPAETWSNLKTSQATRQAVRRIGLSSLKRLLATCAHNATAGPRTLSVLEMEMVVATLRSIPTAAHILRKLYQDVPRCPFRAARDLPETLDCFVIYLGACMMTSTHGHLRVKSWIDPVFALWPGPPLIENLPWCGTRSTPKIRAPPPARVRKAKRSVTTLVGPSKRAKAPPITVDEATDAILADTSNQMSREPFSPVKQAGPSKPVRKRTEQAKENKRLARAKASSAVRPDLTTLLPQPISPIAPLTASTRDIIPHHQAPHL